MIRKLGFGTIVMLFCILLLHEMVLSMSSANFRLDWFTPLTTGGGGASSSANYAVNVSVGQSAIGGSSSTNYAAGLGYWCGNKTFRVYLPIVIK